MDPGASLPAQALKSRYSAYLDRRLSCVWLVGLANISCRDSFPLLCIVIICFAALLFSLFCDSNDICSIKMVIECFSCRLYIFIGCIQLCVIIIAIRNIVICIIFKYFHNIHFSVIYPVPPATADRYRIPNTEIASS